jgi:hypothetical protein
MNLNSVEIARRNRMQKRGIEDFVEFQEFADPFFCHGDSHSI